MSDKQQTSDNTSGKISDNTHQEVIMAYLNTHGEVNAATTARAYIQGPVDKVLLRGS